MKILMLCNTFPPYVRGGAELVAANLSLALYRRGHMVKAFAGCARKNYEKVIYWQEIPVTFVYPGSRILPEPSMNRMLNTFWQIWTHILDLSNPILFIKLQKFFRDFLPDIVHTHNIFGLSPYHHWYGKWPQRRAFQSCILLMTPGCFALKGICIIRMASACCYDWELNFIDIIT
jgi:glycosyltransferase involved in cell wall biosynthesis